MLRSVLFSGLAAVVAAASLAGGGVATPAMAQQAAAAGPAPLSAYGALPSLEMVQLSPSGGRLAFVTVSGEQRVLVLLDMATKAQVGGVDVGRAKVRNLDWIGEEKVLITTTKTESVPQIGVFNAELASGQIYDPARNRITSMLTNTRGMFPIMMSNARIVQGTGAPTVLVRAFSFDNPERLDMYRIDLENGRPRLAEIMGRNVDDFIVDSSGQTIARSEYDPRSLDWGLYLRQGATFRKTWETRVPLDAPRLVGLGMNGDSVVVAADRPDLSQPGRPDAEFFDVNLATGAWRPVRFDFMPQGLIFHPVTHRLIGATRATDQGPVYAITDPAGRDLWNRVRQTFAGRSPTLVSWSDDFHKAVVYTSGAEDAGSYYALDLDAGSIVKIGSSYEAITAGQVAPVRPVFYDAADGTEIRGYLTTPPGVQDPKGLPLVVLPHGGPAAHDILTFDYWAQALASRGYAVLQPNFRGSTDRDDAFLEAGYGEWGRKMQTDLSDGVRWLAGEGTIDPKRVCIVGASYGGYAALAGPTLDPGVYRCAVSVAGVSDLRVMVESEASSGYRENATTRYWNRFMGADGLGDRSLDARSPARQAARADAPILLIHGRDDSVVPIEQSRIMANALRRAGKPVEFVELNGEDHWLSRGDTRTRMLEETVKFLEANNPPN